MAAKKKKVDPVKQREKRTKIALIVGLVVLALAAVYEIPSMLKVMNKKPPPGTTYDPGPSLTPGGLPNVAGGATPSAVAAGQLVDTDVPPASGTGQLVTFSVFETKNPFAPQVTAADASDSSAPTTANKPGADVPTTTTTTPTPPPPLPAGGAVPSTQPPGTGTTPTTTVATPAPSVSIAVNGVVSRVASEGTFPRGTPVFRLVNWTKGSAKIAIVGGSYATGEATLTLHVGDAVTLQNQTDGKRYKLELLSTP